MAFKLSQSPKLIFRFYVKVTPNLVRLQPLSVVFGLTMSVQWPQSGRKHGQKEDSFVRFKRIV